ncbi:MAG TPA: hypothetical protein DCR24_10195 [Bacillus bacterium]|nr:hypothetical protein [Bacillus sp. (in: firmicutes)]
MIFAERLINQSQLAARRLSGSPQGRSLKKPAGGLFQTPSRGKRSVWSKNQRSNLTAPIKKKS